MIDFIYDKEKWDTVLKDIETFDFYHSYEYHFLLKKDDEHPVLITYISGEIIICIPFLKKKINDTYFDLASVHGYLGPISKGVDENFNNLDFKNYFLNFLSENNIVSVFSKLNPYIKHQNSILKSIGEIENIGELVYYNQLDDNEIQTKAYNRNTRQKLKQLKKTCYVKIVGDDESIDNFIQLYHESLNRLQAKEIFYFDKKYFKTLLKSKNFKARMLLAVHRESNEIAGGVFCLKTDHIAHIEIAFTNKDYYKESPIRLLFDESRIIYKQENEKYLNLGGGSGGRDGSLMRFKSSFTQNYIDFNIWRCIILPNVYETLLTSEQKQNNSGFFPKYRLTI